jgi:phenylalanyl-tRNA synthetase alpha chain
MTNSRLFTALAAAAEAIESMTVLAETPADRLPPQAVERLGLEPGRKNMLVRLVLRHPTRTLTDAEANGLRDLVYSVIHEGSIHQWASSRPT